MRNLTELDRYRITNDEVVALYGGVGDKTCGAFELPNDGDPIRVIASSGNGWDHVSVSAKDRCPTWSEMDFVKRLFFHPQETAMQLHVAETNHINYHPYCLHIWRPKRTSIPLPPDWMVGPPTK